MSARGPVTDETVELLRRNGAPEDLVWFAERHVARYSRNDMDREWWHGWWFGIVTAAIIVGAVVVVR